MRSAVGVEDFVRSPRGACVAGSRFVYFHPRAHLCGFALFGMPAEEDLRALETLLRLELTPDFPAHVSLVDASRIESVDGAAFLALSRYVASNSRRLAEQVERLAIVRPPGLIGATVAGFFHVADPPYPVEVFGDLRAAMQWLDEPDDGFADELERVVAEATGAASWLAALRRLLDARPGTVSVEDAARALALSARSLQRRLSSEGTTFQAELARSQVRVAERLLRGSNAPLAMIALEVGCSTPQRFSSLFRRVTGETPSAYRKRVQTPRDEP